MAITKKLYMVGIDAAPLWLMERLGKRKGMENIHNLVLNKQIVEMRSTMPPMTGAAWPTIYTGLTPAEHGVPDFFELKRDYTPELAYYDSRQVPPFWRALAEHSLKCLVITPATDIRLPEYANVDMITGFPLKAKTNSAYLRSLMLRHRFDGEPDIEKDIKAGRLPISSAVGIFAKSITARAEITKSAMENNIYDFVYVCFTETDRLQHFVLNKKKMEEYLLPVYSAIDSFIGYLLGRAEREGSSVIIVSDHGAQPIKEKFLINAWLAKSGYLSIKESALANSTDAKAQLAYTLREKLMKTSARRIYDKLPHSTKHAIFRSLGAVPSARKGRYTRIHLFDMDMHNTRAFAAISNLNVSTLWVNDKRFEKGIVTVAEKKILIKELSKKLKKLRVIKRVESAERYYGRKCPFIAPDLFVEAEDGYSLDIFNYSAGTLFMEPEPPKSGDHTDTGIFGYHPKSLFGGLKSFSIYEVSRSILEYYGLKKGIQKKHPLHRTV